MVYNYDYGIFDQIASEAERRQQAQVEKDDTPDFLQGI